MKKSYVVDGLLQHGSDIRTVDVPVSLRTLDSFALVPRAIKIDAEGAELSVGKGAEETLRQHKPALMIENNDWTSVTEFLASLGYCCYRYLAEENTLTPFYGRTTNAFYIADDPMTEVKP